MATFEDLGGHQGRQRRRDKALYLPEPAEMVFLPQSTTGLLFYRHFLDHLRATL